MAILTPLASRLCYALYMRRPFTLSLDPAIMARARALGLATKTPVSRIVNAGLEREIDALVRSQNPQQRAAYEAFLHAGDIAPPKA